MLKLGRNALSELEYFVDGENRLIEWKFIGLLHDVQEEEGLQFGNKLSAKHIEYKRNKMNVKLAAQTLSSSVADSIEFLRKSGDPRFQGSEGTIEFIRVVDRLFDLLNSRNPYATGYKKPLRLINKAEWFSTVEKSINYLYSLKDEFGRPLLSHRRNTFVKVLIIAAKSVKELAMLLLTRDISPFKYVLTYKFSQDHLELLFSCVRSSGGFNNNPDVRQFVAALKKILLRTSIRGNKYGNCSNLESGCNEPLFQLKWRKAPLVPQQKELVMDEDEELEKICQVAEMEYTMTAYKDNILAYIGGFIVRRILKEISCKECAEALLERQNKNVYYLSLTNIKNSGGLIMPSVEILKKCEAFFRAYVSGCTDDLRISSVPNIKGIIENKIHRELFSESIFLSMINHDFDNCFVTEDLHSTQLTKKIVDHYLRIRFFRYGQRYSSIKLKKEKHGLRQQMNKLILFQGL